MWKKPLTAAWARNLGSSWALLPPHPTVKSHKILVSSLDRFHVYSLLPAPMATTFTQVGITLTGTFDCKDSVASQSPSFMLWNSLYTKQKATFVIAPLVIPFYSVFKTRSNVYDLVPTLVSEPPFQSHSFALLRPWGTAGMACPSVSTWTVSVKCPICCEAASSPFQNNLAHPRFVLRDTVHF